MAISKIGSNSVDTLSSKLTLTAADGVEDNDYIMELTNAEATDGRSYGLRVKAGSTSADQSFVVQDHDASNTLLKVTGDGDVNVGIGDILFGTAGKGINLGVTSNTDSNTLDDYEEGTWTLAPVGADTAGSYSASAMSGHYTKIGRIVHVEFRITSGTISGAGGTFRINGLPFTVGGVGYPTGSSSFFNVDFDPDRRQDVNGSGTYLYFLVSVDNGTWTSIQVGGMSSGHYIHGSLTYSV